MICVRARRVAIGSGREGVVPARSLAEIQVSQVIAAFIMMGGETRPRPIEITVEEIVSGFRDAGFDAVGEMSFLELVKGLGRT